MEYILIGKYVNTHGLKGEIKIISDYRYKDSVFKKGFTIYIGDNKQSFIIDTYRIHKNFDMVTLLGINDINKIEILKGNNVYINKEDLIIDDNNFDVSDLVSYKVFINDKEIGEVIDIMYGKANDILVVSKSRILIPYVDAFILNVDSDNKKITVNDIEGLIK